MQILLTFILIIGMTATVCPHAQSNMRFAAAELFTSPQQIEELTLTLNDAGFTPAEVTRQAGRFQFFVDNRSQSKELVFHLDREDGTRVREVRVTPETVDWSEEVNLSPGIYFLKEASHEQWVCRFIVQ